MPTMYVVTFDMASVCKPIAAPTDVISDKVSRPEIVVAGVAVVGVIRTSTLTDAALTSS